MARRPKPAISIVRDNADEPLSAAHEETLADLVDEYRGNAISRTGFLRGAAVFGLSAGGLGGMLAEAAAARSRAPQVVAKTAAKLNIGVGQDVDLTDPQSLKDLPGFAMMAGLYEQLIDHPTHVIGNVLKADSGHWAPMLARSLEISRDLKKYTFRIDPRARFSDGTPVTSADVRYSLTRGVENAANYTSILMKMLTLQDPAAQLSTPDAHTLVMRLKDSNPMTVRILVLQLLSIMNEKASKAHATSNDKWASGYWKSNVLGTGPYVLQAWNRGVGWTLTPNPKYWRSGLPKNGGLNFRVIADAQERISLVKRGTLHTAFEITAKDASAIRHAGGNVKLVDVPSPWCFGLTFNNGQKPFSDKRVRQALSYAVPYDAILNTVMHGFAKPLHSMVPPGMPTSDGSAWRYSTNLRKAKQLLAAAGHPNGFNSSIDILIGRPEDEQSAVLIQSNFRQIGVNVQINQLDATQYDDNRTNAKSPMQIVEWLSWVYDPYYHLFWNMLSTSKASNFARYHNPKVDKMIMAGIYEADQVKRDELSRQIQRIIIDDAPWAWLYARDYFQPVAANLHNYPYWPDQNPRFGWTYLT